jgi:hypothetical protein
VLRQERGGGRVVAERDDAERGVGAELHHRADRAVVHRHLQRDRLPEEDEPRAAEQVDRFPVRREERDAEDAVRLSRLLAPAGDVLLCDEAGARPVQEEVTLPEGRVDRVLAAEDDQLGESRRQQFPRPVLQVARPEADLRVRCELLH